MPHVKGNKFKPALPPVVPQPEPTAAPPIAAAPPAAAGSGPRRLKKQRRQGGNQEQQQEHRQQHQEPISSATEAAEGQAPHRKKRKLQQQPAAPIIPTVVVPPPKGGRPGAAVARSNWAALQATLSGGKQQQAARQRKPRGSGADGAVAAPEAAVPSRPGNVGSNIEPTKVLALDCEMVGVGSGGQTSMLARVCLVNSAGNVLLDTFVKPRERVTDFRTKVSGVRPADVKHAPPFAEVQAQVACLLQGRVLVGHMLENDLLALLLSHPRRDIRDTGFYPPLMKVQGMTGKLKPRALRHLAAEQLGLQIQAGEHSPVDDARAALYLYQKHRKEWERWVQQGSKQGAAPQPAAAAKGCAAQMQKSLTQLAANDYMSDL